MKTNEAALLPSLQSQGKVGAGGREVVTDCLNKSKSLGFYSRPANAYNWSKYEEVLIGNWMADIGAESQRFPNRSICYTSVTTKSWLYIKEVNLPIIRGYEKYIKSNSFTFPTIKHIETFFSSLNTKRFTPNPRFNKNTIIRFGKCWETRLCPRHFKNNC